MPAVIPIVLQLIQLGVPIAEQIVAAVNAEVRKPVSGGLGI